MEAVEIATDLFVSERPYEKMDGTESFAPWIEIELANLTPNPVTDLKYYAKVDTGADLSAVPRSLAKKLMPLHEGRPVLLRLAETRIKRYRRFMLTLSITGDHGSKIYRPEGGVFLCDTKCGVIGMDVMKHWTATFDGVRQTFTISM